MLAEATTTELSAAQEPQTFEESRQVAKSGGQVAGIARKEIEERTGKSVITAQNAVQLNEVVTQLIEDTASEETVKE